MAIDATVGGASSNCYISLADAETYFTDERLPVTAWSGETDARKENALIMATRRLDVETYEGIKSASGQALKWPRYLAVDDNGDEFNNAAIPRIIADATCELALTYLIADDNSVIPLTDTGLEEFNSAKVGPMDVTRDQSFKAGQLPQNVARLLGSVLTTSGGMVGKIGTAY